MMKKNLMMALMGIASITAAADELQVNKLRVAGPYTTVAALRIDSVDVKGEKFNEDDFLKKSISTQVWKKGEEAAFISQGDTLPAVVLQGDSSRSTVYVAGFTFDNTHFAKCHVKAKGGQSHLIYIDNKEGAEQTLTPGRHEVVVKVLCKKGENDTLSLKLDSKQSAYISLHQEGLRPYTLADYMHGEKAYASRLSANGRYMMIHTYTTKNDGKTEWSQQIMDLKTRRLTLCDGFSSWASTGDRYIRSRRGIEGETVYEYVDPATGEATPFFTNYLSASGNFINDESLMLVSQITEGPKEDAQVHQVLSPEDRQAGWRNRRNIQLLDVASGQLTQVTTGFRNSYASVSRDGQKVLITTSEDELTERPFRFSTVLLYDRTTQKVDTIVRRDGFIGEVRFYTPDCRYALAMGSPEAFGGIGKNDPTGKIPSMIQNELFLIDLTTKEVKSLTRDFNPNITSVQVSEADGMVYALCENRDRQDIFRIDIKSGKISKLPLTECYVKSFSLARGKAMLSYVGQGDSNVDRIYYVDLKNGKETLVKDYNAIRMEGIALGKCEDWYFKSSRGDSICGRYYLPPHFDPSKKYPMLVYYYGGCSPTGRYLDSYYNFHGWAAMGYVVYVVQPSGATGFGQEFAARHVNTYGDGPAQDIIEGTQQFCREHPFVNEKKIGCLGASFGGFMTQYLMTKTDIFAASMSHAGISNPTSYWGFGYWGYTYSAISAAHSYPWNNQELLSGHAPLFNADKVHTPILFLHGAADNNVPINESIQMFTALKILGRECAFVTVEGQDHHITDYQKQIKWVHTYYAWFAKWLQDDPTWWDTLYPKKNL